MILLLSYTTFVAFGVVVVDALCHFAYCLHKPPTLCHCRLNTANWENQQC